jgi:hypothetical protein
MILSKGWYPVKRVTALLLSALVTCGLMLSLTGCPDSNKKTTDTKKTETTKTDSGTVKKTEETKTETKPKS